MDKYTHRHKENVKGMFALIPIIVLIAIVLMFFSCGLRKSITVKTYAPPYVGNVTVLEIGSVVPDGAVSLGDISIGESGFTSTKRCTYDRVLLTAQKIASKMGGNYILIKQHNYPNMLTTCHEIYAEVYYVK